MLLDVTRLLRRSLRREQATGIDRVGLAYIDQWREEARALVRIGTHWLTPSRAASARLFDALLRQNDAPRHLLWRCWIDAMRHHRPVARGTALCNASLTGTEAPAYADRVRRLGLRAFYCLYDLIPITYPEYCRPGAKDACARRIATMAASGSGLIVNSEVTVRDLAEYAHKAKLTLPPVEVIPLGSTPLPPAGAKPAVDLPYFVTIGTIEARKNHLMLLNVWRRMLDTLPPEVVPRLVVIGQRGWECEQVIDFLERSRRLRGFVVETGRCDDAELSTYLHHAQALLFPSFAEGYGLPLVEALACNTPVIASSLDVFREIAGEVPDYLDPIDGTGWLRTILEYSRGSSQLRARQQGRMAGFKAPSWSDHFAKAASFLAR